jgi:hypothetical protein
MKNLVWKLFKIKNPLLKRITLFAFREKPRHSLGNKTSPAQIGARARFLNAKNFLLFKNKEKNL